MRINYHLLTIFLIQPKYVTKQKNNAATTLSPNNKPEQLTLIKACFSPSTGYGNITSPWIAELAITALINII